MDEIRYLVIILILVIVPVSLFGQDNVCDCCSYSSLQYQQDYDKVFNPSLMKSEKIKEVIVFTKPKNADSLEVTKYREIKFKFNENGLVISKLHYNRMGKPHSIYELKRNRYGKISQQIFNYVDSLEQKSSFYSPEIIDFTYDTRKRLLKIKERDYKGKILPDKKAIYTLFRYDSKNRIIKTVNHRVYNNEPSISVRRYIYSNDSLSATYKTTYDGVITLTGKKEYNKNWKELSDKSFNASLNSQAFDESFSYDGNDRLLKYNMIYGNGSATECPEISGFTDDYKYNEEGFLISIKHSFDENICLMIFNYKR